MSRVARSLSAIRNAAICSSRPKKRVSGGGKRGGRTAAGEGTGTGSGGACWRRWGVARHAFLAIAMLPMRSCGISARTVAGTASPSSSRQIRSISWYWPSAASFCPAARSRRSGRRGRLRQTDRRSRPGRPGPGPPPGRRPVRGGGSVAGPRPQSAGPAAPARARSSFRNNQGSSGP
jgi:hypothetical protein